MSVCPEPTCQVWKADVQSSQGIAVGAVQNILGYMFWGINNVYRTVSFSLSFPTKEWCWLLLLDQGWLWKG